LKVNAETQIKSGIYNKGEITLENVIESIKKYDDIKAIGSILTFIGIVRGNSKEGRLVKGLKIDAYDELANKNINKICEKVKKRKGIIEVILVHFKGDFELSEDLVYVVVASSHREEGFVALRETVELYKKEIAVWKRENFLDDTSEWVH
jgi:molybdopterin synthase catalytic subunit